MNPEPEPLSILYQGDDIVVIDKPAGILTVPDRTGRPSVTARMRTSGYPVVPVHRLDFDTCGVLVFALQADAHRRWNGYFAGRKVEKLYLARVAAPPPAPAGWVIGAIGPGRKGMMRIRADGKPARSLFLALDEEWVAVWPLEGRRHQVRLHLAGIGAPVRGDRGYYRTARVLAGVDPEGEDERMFLCHACLRADGGHTWRSRQVSERRIEAALCGKPHNLEKVPRYFLE